MSHAEKTKQLSLAIEHLDKELGRTLILEDDIKPTDVTDEQYSRFFKLAVESRDSQLVRKLLETRPKLDGTLGAQLLWKVIDDDDTQIAEMLVRAGADLNQSFHKHSSSLLQVLATSSECRKLELALLMMEHGADVTVRDARGRTAFGLAIKHENLAFAQELLKWGVKVDGDLLCTTINFSSKPLESMLLLVNGDHVQDATTRSKLVTNAFTVLCCLTLEDKYILDMAEALLDLEIPPVYRILDAVRFEKFDMVKLILERADISRATKMTFLLEAVDLTRTNMARLLIEWGADIEYNDPEELHNTRGVRALHFACWFHSLQHIQLLLHLGADVNAVDFYGATPFSYLANNFYAFAPDSYPDARVAESCRLVVKYLALSMSKGVMVDGNDLALIRSYPIVKKIYDECSAELQTMKDVVIIGEFPFYSIFTKSIQDLSLFVKRQSFVDGYNNRLNSFPAYRSELNMRIREAERRSKLLIPKEDAIYEALREILPDIPMEKIIRYLYLSEVETVKDRIMMLDSDSNELCMESIC